MGSRRSIDEMAARQGGAFSRVQAIECGFSYDAIQRLVARGIWLQLDDSVYASAASPATWDRRIHSAVLSRPQAYAAGRSAAYLLGMGGFTKSVPEILVPFEGNARSRIARVIRSRHFHRVATTSIDGLPVTTVAETILTLSFREPGGAIERVVDNELATRSLRIEDFDPILERLENARMRGLPALRRIVADRDHDSYQPPASELERLLYAVLADDDLPASIRQLPIDYPSGPARVDAYIPEWRLIVEADGRRWHTKSEDFERDRLRDNAAAGSGFGVIRLTYRMLRDDQRGCVETIGKAGQWRTSA